MYALFAVVCPPLAVLATGTPSQAAANVGLTLMGYVPGMLHALNVVERHTITKRNDALLRAVELHYA